MSIEKVKILELFSVHHNGLLYGGCIVLVFLNREGAKDAKIYVFLPNRAGRFDKAIGPVGMKVDNVLGKVSTQQRFSEGIY